MAAPMPEAWSKELLLTGHAAAAGHAVTYTTTTTTTTAVTINGAAASPGAAFTPQAPAGPPIEYAPQAAPGQPPASPSGPGGPGGGGREKALPAPEPTEEDMKAMVAARQLNNGIPRVQWQAGITSEVWDTFFGKSQAALLSAAWANIPELAERGAKNSLRVVTSKKITRSDVARNKFVVGLAVKHLGMRPSMGMIDQAVYQFFSMTLPRMKEPCSILDCTFMHA
ncbi:unnamed protein product [Durusdinium trenchii]|uniref:Uncharacterized protein n=1 Tax=Durusdinium trenchii TaxID=1381693 RepID=A0ABP0M4B6_9DINO